MFDTPDQLFSIRHKPTGHVSPAATAGYHYGDMRGVISFINKHDPSTHVEKGRNREKEICMFHIGNNPVCDCAESFTGYLPTEDFSFDKTIIFYDKEKGFNVDAFGSKNPTHFFILSVSNPDFKQFERI